VELHGYAPLVWGSFERCLKVVYWLFRGLYVIRHIVSSGTIDIIGYLPYIIIDRYTTKEKTMSIGNQLRSKIQAEDATLYRIAKDSELDWGTLQRFLDGTRPNIRLDTIEKLCCYFDLELQPKKKISKKK
jgi:DNA-binding Xre family transcriptional regulator